MPITTAAGNFAVELGAENARKFVDLSGRTNLIVAKRAARPLQRTLITAEAIHGENGLGGSLADPENNAQRRHAVQVTQALIEAKTREIIPMGGTVAGNATPVGGANIYHDAEAAGTSICSAA